MGVNGTGYFNLSLEYVIITTSCIIAAVGVTGNLFVLVICARLRKQAGMYGIYYASLALADFLLMGPCLIPQIWAHCEGHVNVTISENLVQVWGFTYITARVSSILNLSVIALERMVAVMFPHFYRTRVDKSHAIVTVSVVWLLSLLVALSPYMLNEGFQYYQGAAMASVNYALALNMTFFIATEIPTLYLPTAIIILSVGVISCRVRRLKRRDNRITRTLLTVLCAYIACFTVYFVWIILRFVHALDNAPTTVQLYLQNFSFLILGIHSAVNPIIYAFKAAQFKEEVGKINDRAILQCIALLIKMRPQAIHSSDTTMRPTMHKSLSDTQRLENIELELRTEIF